MTQNAMSRGEMWLRRLASCGVEQALGAPSVLCADIDLKGKEEMALGIAIVRDPESRMPRAAHGELGLEQAWAISARIRQFIADEKIVVKKRAILAIVDTPGQAFGRSVEQLCISAAAGSAVDAYATARHAGHPVLTFVVGRAISGSFLAHGLQSDYIIALASDGVCMHAMSAQSVARITRRTLSEVEAAAAVTPPMSFAIADAHRLGVVDGLVEGANADDPSCEDLDRMREILRAGLLDCRKMQHSGGSARALVEKNPMRQATASVRLAMREQWFDEPIH